jgi:metal-responsive CopG/Arc/MetJ family transcriptional regulator
MTRTHRKLKRGAYTREGCVFIGAWFPSEVVEAIDVAVVEQDLDRSKILRRAIEETLRQPPKEQAA